MLLKLNNHLKLEGRSKKNELNTMVSIAFDLVIKLRKIGSGERL